MANRAMGACPAPTNQTAAATAIEGVQSPPRGTLGVARRFLVIGCLGALLTSTTGCQLSSGIFRAFRSEQCIDDFMIGYRNRALAEKAWYRLKDRFPSQRYPGEFKDGFISGYMDIASGGNGCCPTVAPSRYWGWRYQSGYGQQAINAWFNGFPLGVQAADQDGAGNWQEIRTLGLPPPQVTVTEEVGTDETNPFYPEDEYVPLPEAIESFDNDASGSGILDGALSEPENASLDMAVETLPATEQLTQDEIEPIDETEPIKEIEPINEGPELELVMQPRPAPSFDASAVSITNTNDSPPESDPVVIDDVFGSSDDSIFRETESTELPFTFE